MKRVSILVLLMIVSGVAAAQFKTATIGIDGLTCSMCSYSVERSIKKLPFISTVKVDLNGNTATVEFKAGDKIDMHRLIKSVIDAGFAVRDLTAKFDFGESIVVKDNYFQHDDSMYMVLENNNTGGKTGIREVKFIERTFSEKTLYKKHRSVIEKSSSDNFTNASYYVLII